MTVDRNRFAQYDFHADARMASPETLPHNGHTSPFPSASNKRMPDRRSTWWPFPGLIFVLLATNVSIVSITALYAVSDSSFAIEPEYYKQAVTWDRTMAQRNRNRELGWTIAMPPSVSGQPVALRVFDRDGEPVSGARVDMIAFHNAHSGNRLSATLAEIEPGMYRSNETLVRSGSWEVRISAVRADQTYTSVIAHTVQATEARP